MCKIMPTFILDSNIFFPKIICFIDFKLIIRVYSYSINHPLFTNLIEIGLIFLILIKYIFQFLLFLLKKSLEFYFIWNFKKCNINKKIFIRDN